MPALSARAKRWLLPLRTLHEIHNLVLQRNLILMHNRRPFRIRWFPSPAAAHYLKRRQSVRQTLRSQWRISSSLFESPSPKYQTPSSGIPTRPSVPRRLPTRSQSPSHSSPWSLAGVLSRIQLNVDSSDHPPTERCSCPPRPLCKALQTIPSDHPSA